MAVTWCIIYKHGDIMLLLLLLLLRLRLLLLILLLMLDGKTERGKPFEEDTVVGFSSSFS